MILKNNNFFHFFFYIKINTIIFNINFFNFNKIINIFYKNNNFNVIMLNNSLDFKYSWSNSFNIVDESGETEINFFKNSLNYFSNKFFNNLTKFNSNGIIIFKKKTSLFKKVFDIDYVILNKVNDYKNNTEVNFFRDLDFKFNSNFFDNNISIKTIDLKKKFKLLYNVNRKIIKNIFNIKKIKQHALTRKIKHLCNLKKNSTIIKLENNCFNVIMSSDFFFSVKDCNWFFLNGMIYLNSSVVKNPNQLLKPYDVLQINKNNYYYDFYKNILNFLILNTYKINSKLWSINKNRHEKAYYKDVKTIVTNENYPKFFENYKFFKKDLPLNLEIDYISMTIILLYNNNNNPENFNFYNFKFYNFYLNRLYNWKHIT